MRNRPSKATAPALPGAAPELPRTNATTDPAEAHCWRTEDLLGTSDEALIVHGDQTYRLRRTKTGKLILTK